MKISYRNLKERINLRKFLNTFGMLIVLILIMIAFGLLSPVFWSLNNLINILRQVSIVGVCSVGMAMVIIVGGIDLSVGSTVAVSGIVAAIAMKTGVIPPVVAVLISLAVGLAVGLFNAFIINEFDLPPFVATLGTMSMLRGVAYLVTGGYPVFGFPSSYTVLGQGNLGFIPIPVIVMLAVFALGVFIMNSTRWGRYIYGVGGNQDASRLSGVSPKKIRYFVYTFNGILTALAGTVLLSRVNSATPSAGTGYEMDVITAVILGGVSMSGGEGNILGVLVGVIIMGVLVNGMTLLNVNEYWQLVVKGGVLILAVILDRLSKRQKN